MNKIKLQLQPIQLQRCNSISIAIEYTKKKLCEPFDHVANSLKIAKHLKYSDTFRTRKPFNIDKLEVVDMYKYV